MFLAFWLKWKQQCELSQATQAFSQWTQIKISECYRWKPHKEDEYSIFFILQQSRDLNLMSAQEKQMEVCEVCGAFLIIGDAQTRVDDHLQGKQHMGYAKIKSTIEELKVSLGWRLDSVTVPTEAIWKISQRNPKAWLTDFQQIKSFQASWTPQKQWFLFLLPFLQRWLY